MKKIKLLFVFIIGMMVLQSYGQTITNIVNVDSTQKKSTLYSNALSFFALEFKSANNVIQMKDSETGKIIGKGIIDDRLITIGITCKDGKYKYDLDIEPYKNLIAITLTFTPVKFGMYSGITVGQLQWINNIAVINDVKFIFDMGKKYGGNWVPVYLDGTGKPMGMNNAYEKWKTPLEAEIDEYYKKFANMSNPNEDRNKKIINSLISNLEKEMSKKSEW